MTPVESDRVSGVVCLGHLGRLGGEMLALPAAFDVATKSQGWTAGWVARYRSYLLWSSLPMNISNPSDPRPSLQ